MLLALVPLAVGPMPAWALERLAVVAPIGERYPVLGAQVVRGAREALGLPPDGPVEAGAVSGDPTLIVIDDPCRGGDDAAEDGATVSQALVEADADAAVGLICWSTLEAALSEGTLDGLPLVTVGVRAEALTDNAIREGWSAWRVAPRVGDEARALARHILSAWRDQPFAVLDDGTIYGRELAEQVGVALAQRGAEPVYTETYRPAISRQFGLARRLASSGASHVFLAGERRDAAIIARDAVAAELDLEFLGGDAMRARDDDVPLPPGVRAVVFLPALQGGYRATTRAAVELLLAAAKEAKASDVSLDRALALGPYETSLGALAFDLRGDLRANIRRDLFAVREWNGREWVEPGQGPASDELNGSDGATDAANEPSLNDNTANGRDGGNSTSNAPNAFPTVADDAAPTDADDATPRETSNGAAGSAANASQQRLATGTPSPVALPEAAPSPTLRSD